MINRRNFIKSSAAFSALASLPLSVRWALAQTAFGTLGLSDPALQPKFVYDVPDAMAPGFKFNIGRSGKTKVTMAPAIQQTGLVDANGALLNTPVFGYGENGSVFTWPGKTFEVQSGVPLEVKWENKLYDPVTGLPALHPIVSNAGGGFANGPVDTSLHWCYSLPGYEAFNIATNGVPIVPHLHGGHTTAIYDGNPEYFFSPGYGVVGPRWVEKKYIYDNDQPAGNLWYHDHALGITRLNVYAGLAGFYFIRDNQDTGLPGNPLGLPAWPYEKAYAIQDRMFKDTGELFYPAFPGDPYYADFITGEGATPPAGATAMAEFFGDHMVVNGVIWPREVVEPRNYRMHLLNGTDSRFMALQLFEVPAGATDFTAIIQQLPFTVVGSDQGLASAPTSTDMLLFEPGSRYDIVVDFSQVTPGNRVIMKNIGGDEPFGGAIPGPQIFGETDRVMAFDVTAPFGTFGTAADVSPIPANFPSLVIPASAAAVTIDRTGANARKVALFEGKDDFGRLQPLLGTAEPATDELGNPINWPATPVYQAAGLIGQMEGSIPWHSPTTENPQLGATEDWDVYNVTGDGHPVHLHLVHFEIVERREIAWDSNTVSVGDMIPDGTGGMVAATEDDVDRVIPNVKANVPMYDGTYLETQPVIQHNSTTDPLTWGNGFRIKNATAGPLVVQPAGYVENAPKDMVTALPDQITRIKAHFDKPGRYVWHCHILSHEDHEMMRVLHVGPGA